MKKVLLGCVCVVLLTQGVAQKTLTFEEAIKIGMERNVLVKQQRNVLEGAQVSKTSAFGAFMPNVNITSTFQRQSGQQPNTLDGGLEDLKTNYFGAQLNGNLTLFNGIRGINNVLQARSWVMAQGFLMKRTQQDVLNTVALQYLQVLLDQELLSIAQENLTTQKSLLEQMQGFFDVGTRAITDVYNQDALMKAADANVIRAKNTLLNDKALLAQTLQLDPAQDFEVVYPEFKEDYIDYSKLAMDSLMDVAQQNRADLQQLKYVVKANRFTHRAAIAGMIPTLSAFANYGSFYYSLIPENFNAQFKTLNPSLSYGANLNIPLFSRMVNKNQRALALVQVRNSELNRQNLEKTVKLDVKRALSNLINAKESLFASKSQFESGELALRTQRESYELGISNQVALAQATQTYVQGASAKAQAEVTLIFNRMMLDYALGTLKTDDWIAK